MNGRIPRIVVIDDSKASVSLYERSTMPLAVDLAAFGSPDASLAYLDTHPVDLVFLDILMHDADGMALLKDIRGLERTAETPVVIVTSKDYFQDRARAKELGAQDYLVKPLRSQEIRDIICKYTNARPASE